MANRSTNINRGLNNRSDGHLLGYFRNTFVRGGGGSNFDRRITITSGTPFSPGDGYTYVAFTGTGDFTVDGTHPGIEYLVVAAGGAGGATAYTGGGGGGGFRTGTIPNATGPYPVTVGAGGASVGSPSYIGPPSAKVVESTGGGNAAPGGTQTGGSGAGANYAVGAGASGNTPPTSPPQGNPGGPSTNTPASYSGTGGGGGAGTSGFAGVYSGGSYGSGGNGGTGAEVPGWNIPASYGTPGPTPGRFFAGGGGGGNINTPGSTAGNGGAGGGGQGQGGPSSPTPRSATAGATNTGGGGGGASNPPSAGNGGSGIVIIRYLP
jgi:hypothetical protein